jgi:hypothetical protein
MPPSRNRTGEAGNEPVLVADGVSSLAELMLETSGRNHRPGRERAGMDIFCRNQNDEGKIKIYSLGLAPLSLDLPFLNICTKYSRISSTVTSLGHATALLLG